MGKDLNRHFTQEDIQMTSDYMKRCFTSYIIGEMQSQTMRYHYTPIRMAKIQNTTTTKCWWRCGATGTLIHYWGCKTVWSFWKSLVISYKIKHILTIWFSNHAHWYLPKWAVNLCPHKSLHTDIYSNFIHNCQNL